MKNDSNKSKRLEMRMSQKEKIMIKQKAENYINISRMVLEAIRQFDNIGTMRKIAALNEMIAFYKGYQQDLSSMRSDFNQVVKRRMSQPLQMN